MTVQQLAIVSDNGLMSTVAERHCSNYTWDLCKKGCQAPTTSIPSTTHPNTQPITGSTTQPTNGSTTQPTTGPTTQSRLPTTQPTQATQPTQPGIIDPQDVGKVTVPPNFITGSGAVSINMKELTSKCLLT